MSSEIIKNKTEIAEKTIEVYDGSDTSIRDPTASSSDASSEEEGRYTQTHRGLKSRHIQLIALGGCIGTGLFVGTGSTLSLVGPAPLVMSFITISALVWVVMQSLAEMTTYQPVRGVSVPFYVDRYLCPSLAFAAGWNYWYSYAMLVAAEISAASVVIEYWENPVPTAVWITVFLATILLLNTITVSLYGESEFWFASLKIIAILALTLLGTVLFFGGGPKQHHPLYFHYWSAPPGAFKSYPTSHLGALGKFLACWTALIRSGFAFVLGPELITIAAGESEAPRRNIPKASRRFIWRLVVFYILGTLVISVIVSSDDPALLQAVSTGTKDAGASPFVLGIKNAGIKGLDHVVNAVILTSAWSAANGFLYAGSRSLYSMAVTGNAPGVFSRCSEKGVPLVAVLSTGALASLTFLSVNKGSSVVLGWFLNLTTVSGYVAWVNMLGAYLRFRTALAKHSLLPTLPYTTRGQPYITYIALSLLIFLTLTNGFQIFFPGNFSAANFLAAYVTLPAFLALYLGHKMWHRTPWVRPLKDVAVGMGEGDEEFGEGVKDEEAGKRSWGRRFWHWVF